MGDSVPGWEMSIRSALEAFYERGDLATYLEAFHPSAWIMCGTELRTRSAWSVSHLEGHLEAVLSALVLDPLDPPPRFECLRTTELFRDGSEAMGIACLRVWPSGLEVEMVVRAFHEAPGWQMGGLFVTRSGQPLPSLKTLPIHMAAQVAMLETFHTPTRPCLTPFELAWLAGRELTRLPLLALEESRFTCHHSGLCCTGKMHIELTDAATAPFREIDLTDVDPAVPDQRFRAGAFSRPWRLEHPEGVCVFRVDERCVVHRAVGYVPFMPCATYPVGFTLTPVGICVWTTFTCPSARGNRGQSLSERETDLLERFRMIEDGVVSLPPEIPMAPDGMLVPYSDYLEIEGRALDQLLTATGSVQLRVSQIVREVHLTCASRGGPSIPDDALAVGVPWRTRHGVTLARTALSLILMAGFPELAPRWAHREGLARLDLVADWPIEEIADAPDEDLLVRYLRQVIWRKRGLEDIGILGCVNVLAWVESILRDGRRTLAFLDGRSSTTRQDLERMIVATEHALFHASGFHEGVLDDPDVRPHLAMWAAAGVS